MKSAFLSSVYTACVLATLLGAVSASPIPHPHPHPQLTANANANVNDVLIPRVGPEVDVRPSLVQSDLASRSDSFIDGDGDAMLFRRAGNEPKESSAQSPVRTDAATTGSGGQNPYSGGPNASAGSLLLKSGPSGGSGSGGKGEGNLPPQDSKPGSPNTGHDFSGTSSGGLVRHNFKGIVTVDGEPTQVTAVHLTTDLHTGPGTTLHFD